MKTYLIIFLLMFIPSSEVNAQTDHLTSDRQDSLKYKKLRREAAEHYIRRDFAGTVPVVESLLKDYGHKMDSIETAKIRHSLGELYMSLGDWSKAESIFLETISFLEKGNLIETTLYMDLCNSLFSLYFQTHNYKKAKKYISTSKKLHEYCHDFSDKYTYCLSGCALVEIVLGNHIIAKFYTDVALKLMRENFNDDSFAHEKYATLYDALEEMESIGDFLKETDDTTRTRQIITLLSNAAVVYEAAGFKASAISCIKESIELGDSIGVSDAFAYNNLGCMYASESRYSEAIPYLEKAYNNASLQYEFDEIATNYALVKYLNNENIGALAEEISQKIRKHVGYFFAHLSTEERFDYWQNIRYYVPSMNILIYEQGESERFGTVYDNILYTKGLLLKTSNGIRDAIYASGNDKAINLYNQVLCYKKQLQTEKDKKNYMLLNNEIEKIDKLLSRTVKEYDNSEHYDWTSIRDILNKDEIAIEFYNIPEIQRCVKFEETNEEPRYCAVMIKKGYKRPIIIPLYKESEFSGVEESDNLYNYKIYNMIWRKLESELKGVKNVYFAPDCEFHKTAIEYALIDGNKRMSDKYNMVRLSSTRELVERKAAKAPQSAVLYGGLKYDIEKDELIAESRKAGARQLTASRAVGNEALRYGVSYLKGTEIEVGNIETELKKRGIECETFSGSAGTEESFRALSGKPIDILHLATHGYFWSDEDAERRKYIHFLNSNNNTEMRAEDKAMLKSGLFFSGANVSLRGDELPDDVEDGVMTAMELSNLNLGNVDLVVLSACQSGLGETSEEGVFGLQRGFKLAGAKTLLMSLWKVDDKATQILMTEFYKNLLAGNTKIESLKKAQKVLQADETYKDPEYWAAWILLDALN